MSDHSFFVNLMYFLLTVCALEIYPGRGIICHIYPYSAIRIRIQSMLVFEGIIVIFCPFCYRLEGQFLKESFCGSFAEILRKKTTLRELDLLSNDTNEEAVKMLCEGLKHPNCNVKKLGWVISVSFSVWYMLLSLECLSSRNIAREWNHLPYITTFSLKSTKHNPSLLFKK